MSHYHEAAYDAFMTGFSFANILKYKEFAKEKQKEQKPANASSGPKGAKNPKEELKLEQPVPATRLNYEHAFAAQYFNKVMLNPYTMEFYGMDPSKQVAEDKDYSKVVLLHMQDGVANEMIDKFSSRFSEFGDFNIYKDSQNSFIMEFYFLEPTTIPS